MYPGEKFSGLNWGLENSPLMCYISMCNMGVNSFNVPAIICQGASRTSEDGERERRTGDERDERIGGAPRGSASRGLPPGPTSGAANRVRNGPEQAMSNPASRVQQSGEFTAQVIKMNSCRILLGFCIKYSLLMLHIIYF